MLSFVTSSYLRLNQHKQPSAPIEQPKQVSIEHLCSLLLPTDRLLRIPTL